MKISHCGILPDEWKGRVETVPVNCSCLVHPWNQKKTAHLNENFLPLLTDSESLSAVWQEQLVDQKFFLCLFYFLFSQAQGIFHLTIPASHLSSYTAWEQCAQQGEDSRPRRPPIHPTSPTSFPTYLNVRFSPDDFANIVSTSIQLNAVWRLPVSGSGSATRFNISALIFE